VTSYEQKRAVQQKEARAFWSAPRPHGVTDPPSSTEVRPVDARSLSVTVYGSGNHVATMLLTIAEP